MEDSAENAKKEQLAAIRKQKAELKKQNHEKMKDMKSRQKEIDKELDELEDWTAKAKISYILAFLLIVGIFGGIILLMIKADVGSVSSQVLAPMIGGVPYLREILPEDLQRLTPAEIAAQTASDTSAAQAASDTSAAQAASDTSATLTTQVP